MSNWFRLALCNNSGDIIFIHSPRGALARHLRGTCPACTALAWHLPGTCPGFVWEWPSTCPAVAQHLPGTCPALARHLPGEVIAPAAAMGPLGNLSPLGRLVEITYNTARLGASSSFGLELPTGHLRLSFRHLRLVGTY